MATILARGWITIVAVKMATRAIKVIRVTKVIRELLALMLTLLSFKVHLSPSLLLMTEYHPAQHRAASTPMVMLQ